MWRPSRRQCPDGSSKCILPPLDYSCVFNSKLFTNTISDPSIILGIRNSKVKMTTAKSGTNHFLLYIDAHHICLRERSWKDDTAQFLLQVLTLSISRYFVMFGTFQKNDA